MSGVLGFVVLSAVLSWLKESFWEQCSCKQGIDGVNIQTDDIQAAMTSIATICNRKTKEHILSNIFEGSWTLNRLIRLK